MNPKSLAKTLPGDRNVKAATLKGYRRKMNVPFDGYAYLNLIPDETHSVSGVLIPVTAAEFDLFSKREESYNRIDVTGRLDVLLDGNAYAFIAPDMETDLTVPRSYIETCTVAMPSSEKEQWIKDTLMNGVYEDLDNPVYEFYAIPSVETPDTD